MACGTIDSDYYRQLVRKVVHCRKFILAVGPPSRVEALLRTLRTLGAAKPLVLGHSLIDEKPSIDDAYWEDIAPDLSWSNTMESIRCYEQRLSSPVDRMRRVVECYDPHEEATVLAAHVSAISALFGRRRYGLRRAEWIRLEDKVLIDAFWELVGIAHVPYTIVEPTPGTLLPAAREFDEGAGAIIAGDARSGVHGGATFTRWVRNDSDAAAVSAFFSAHCDRVRVMPFLRGTPCSIHGVVFPNEVITLRPVEMLTFRKPGNPQMFYAGAATFWDPDVANRASLRAVARIIGTHLKGHMAYRGGFTIDGVMTESGFFPTELNTRAGATLALFEKTSPEIPLDLLVRMVADGEDADYEETFLEELLVDNADRLRLGECKIVCARQSGVREGEFPLFLDGSNGWMHASSMAQADALLSIRCRSDHIVVSLQTTAHHRIPIGNRFAPLAAAALAFADEQLGAGCGSVVPASVS